MKRRSDPGTKERILDAAEQLFAEHGFDATSLRMITTAAQVNLAAVNYHFRSKEALVQAVFARRLGPINRKRLEMLNEVEARTGGAALPLEAVLEAFFAPAVRCASELPGRGIHLRRLMGRMYSEPGERVQAVMREQFEELAVRFPAALKRALPDLPPVELYWRLHFSIGSMAHTLAGAHYLPFYSGGLCDPTDIEGTVERLVAFLAAGLRAPVNRRPEENLSDRRPVKGARRSRKQ
jgi:AcrR family transcriptional regulator